jgi:hypothetical protein
MDFHVLQATDDLKKKQKRAFKTNALSQKDKVQPKTNVALPNDTNVCDAREFIQENKK